MSECYRYKFSSFICALFGTEQKRPQQTHARCVVAFHVNYRSDGELGAVEKYSIRSTTTSAQDSRKENEFSGLRFDVTPKP
jgi:hypothetical protein